MRKVRTIHERQHRKLRTWALSLLALALLVLLHSCAAWGDAAAAVTVTLQVTEITYVNGYHGLTYGAGEIAAGVDFWSTPHNLLVVAWQPSGPITALEDSALLGGFNFGEGCAYATDPQIDSCSPATDTIVGPFVDSVTLTGDFGSLMMGFGAAGPVEILASLTEYQTTAVPEPATRWLFAIGVLAAFGFRKRAHGKA